MKNLNQNILTSINDAYVDTSSTVYDGIWPPSPITHINEERMKYNYDAMGHQIIVLSPYKAASRLPRKIRFEFFPKERKAHTIHYTQDGNIDTYTFADSLMRAVQTKQTGVVWNGGSTSKVSIVSGRAVLDAFGRNIASYYPVTESYGNIGTYNTATGDLEAKTEYNTHDRTTEVTLADGSTTKSAYTIVSHDGVPMLETKVTDALGRTAESYTDEKGRNRETVQHAGGENITVRYAYNPVNEVTTVTHPNGRETKYEYDLLGRKLMVSHPDAGETDMTYDAAGNLLTKLTAQLRKSISEKGCITYTYDYERLKEVLYPENLFNRVTYTYGQPGDKYNRAGRLALVEDASGGEGYYYGRQGVVIKTVRTVMASVADIRTYVYGATYDSWNRVRTMTYPDGEVVTYHYNAAGQVESLTSSKQDKESTIVAQIGYDKDGHTVYQKLGNGTETTYTYDKQRERLQDMTLTGSSSTLMQNKYRYDAVDNILGITNAATPQGLTKLNKAKLGGASTHSYQYDELNRLIYATGKAKSATYDMAMTFGRMSEPLTKVQKVDSSLTAKSYNFAYKYEDESHPTAPTQIGHDHYTYDANGNPILVTNDSTNTTREMYWDEDNRLMVLSDNDKTSRYTYNAGGERIIKSYGTMEGVYINGAPQGITFHETDNFTLYPASILTVNKNRFTKHYFIGSQRIASRIGTGTFNNVYGVNGSYVTAGQQDYAERMNQIESQKEAYYKELGIAPGVPTMKGAYGDPENTGVGYNTIITNLGDHSVPEGWVQTPKHNTREGGTPGTPISWNDPSTPDDPQVGYGYIPNDTTNEETFFFHSDHLGSTSYITDDKGNITQYDAYLPYGELLVDEHSSSEEMPYKFNGKEFDEETGLYYYGARYMNPVTNLWYGVDPLAEKYASISNFSYRHGNPIILVDPNGTADHNYTTLANTYISNFESRTDLTPVFKNIPKKRFIADLKARLKYPSGINQGNAGSCGSAVLTKYLAQERPDIFAATAISLYVNGKATHNQMTISVSESMEEGTLSQLKAIGGSNNVADAIMQGAITNTNNKILSYNHFSDDQGAPDHHWYNRFSKWYKGVTSFMYPSFIGNFISNFVGATISNAGTSTLDLQKIDYAHNFVIALIHQGFSAGIPNHYVQIRNVERNTVHFWSWGENWKQKLESHNGIWDVIVIRK